MLALLFLATFVAFGISAVSGGGASLLLVPILGHMLVVTSVPAALSIGTCSSSISRIATFRQHIHWGVSAWFVPAALPMAVVGALLLRFMNPAYVQLLMAGFMIANLPKLLRKNRSTPPKRISRWVLVGVGAAAGFLSGLTGAVGVLFNRFYFSYGLSKQEIVATRATNEVLIHIAKLVVYGSLGLIDGRVLTIGFIVAGAAVLSSLVLKPLLHKVPHEAFVKVGYAAMVGSGIVLLSSALSRVVREEKVEFDYGLILRGADAKVRWRESSLAIELEYDDGLEVEVDIDPDSLTDAQKTVVARENPGGASILLEAVFSFEGHYHEAYYLRDGNVVKKIAFDAQGLLVPEHD